MEELPGALRAAFAGEPEARRACAAHAPDASVEQVDDTFGIDSARDLLIVQQAGRFAIHPPWLDPPPGRLGIEIDPGHAFGSGSHASTRLALRLLGEEAPPPRHVADVGCGSGVLSIGAALLGAEVTAIDIDPAAITATAANAERNDVAGRVTAILGSADLLVQPTDLVIINVTIDIHEMLATTLAPSHGRLIVAGLLGGDQLDRCAAAYGATPVRTCEDDDWMAAVLTRS